VVRAAGAAWGWDKLGVSAYQLVDNVLYEWRLQRVQAHWVADLAFLEFECPPWWQEGESATQFPIAKLDLHPPVVGGFVRAFGLPESSIYEGTLGRIRFSGQVI
jgi:hypothetical protein